jgi:hypothetical protein
MLSRALVLTACLCAPGLAFGQMGGPSMMPQMQIRLTTDTVQRILKALPELTQATSEHQSQFMGSLTGGGSGPPQMSEDEINKLRQTVGLDPTP